MGKRIFLITGLLLGMVSNPLYAQVKGSVRDVNVVERIGVGEINWTTGTVKTTGIGAAPDKAINAVQSTAMAERAAVSVARRNLIEIIKGVRIDSETTVENFITTSDIVKSQVNGIIQGAQITETRNLAGGGVEVVMEITLHGAISDSLLPKSAQLGSQIPSAMSSDKVYTGLIVDARGISLRPAMAPKIISEKGEEVYGSSFVNRDYAVAQGMAGYSRNLEEASKNERVASAPLVIKALKAANNSDVVISDQDAMTLLAAAKNQKFLEQCKVLFVVN